MNQVITIQNEDTRLLATQIGELICEARRQVAVQVNSQLLVTYWHIGQLIVEHEQKSCYRAEYGKRTLLEVSRLLTREYGKGFSRSNLQWMRLLYVKYPKCQTLSSKLSWSHYCELLSISDDQRRSFYEKECQRAGWSLRELKRQVDSSLFERLLLSKSTTPTTTHPSASSCVPTRTALMLNTCLETSQTPYSPRNTHSISPTATNL